MPGQIRSATASAGSYSVTVARKGQLYAESWWVR